VAAYLSLNTLPVLAANTIRLWRPMASAMSAIVRPRFSSVSIIITALSRGSGPAEPESLP
jgi:hypothetical protein